MLLIPAPAAAAAPGSPGPPPERLSEGAVVSARLDAEGVHRYRVVLLPGRFLGVAVEQRGIDVVVRALAPDGRRLAEVDSPNGSWGAERLAFLAEAAGAHTIEVASFDPNAASGGYELRLDGPREPSAEDRSRVAAEADLVRARAASGRRDAKSRREAEELYRSAAAGFARLGDRVREAEVLEEVGQLERLAGNAAAAREALARALELRGDPGDARARGRTLNQLGLVHDALGAREEARAVYRQALSIFDELDDPAAAARVLNNLGLLDHRSGELPAALEAYRLAYDRFVRAGDRRRMAIALNNLGSVHQALGEPTAAFRDYRRALALVEETGDRQRQAEVWNNLGLAHDELGEAQEALDGYRAALRLFEELGDRRRQARVQVNLGALHFDLGRSHQAVSAFEAALPLLQDVGDAPGEAAALNQLGRAYAAGGERERALAAVRASLALATAADDRAAMAAALTNLGSFTAGTSQGAAPEEAGGPHPLADLDRALELRHSLGDRAGQARTLLARGRARVALDQAFAARADLEAALALARAVGDRRVEAGALVAVARVQQAAGDLAGARQRLEPALELIEALRSGVAGGELRTSYLASRREAYELTIDVLLGLDVRHPGEGFAGAALEVAERARARGMLDLLREARVDLRAGADRDLLERERSLRRRLRARADGGPAPEGAPLELEELLAAYREVRSEIRARSPRYAALVDPAGVRPDALQRHLLGEDTLLLEYFLGEERSYLWIVTPTAIDAFPLPPRHVIETAAREAHARLEVRDPRGREAQSAALAALARLVLAPVADRLDPLSQRRIVVVADGALELVPFGVLPVPGAAAGEPLLASHEVVSLPSAAVLAELRARPQRSDGGDGAGAVAVIYDPVFAADDPRLPPSFPGPTAATAAPSRQIAATAAPSGDGGLSRLPWTAREAAAIEAEVPGGEVLSLRGVDANLKEVAGPAVARARIVHFATHGIVDGRHPELSGLALSRFDAEGRPRPGFLGLPDVYALALAARLVVLSGCSTAAGPEMRGEGLLALTRGFFYAGAPRLVASLWAIDDQASAELMARFYRALFREGLPASAALRAAQRSLAAERRYEDPFYWGGFVFQGDWTADG